MEHGVPTTPFNRGLLNIVILSSTTYWSPTPPYKIRCLHPPDYKAGNLILAMSFIFIQ